MIILLGEAALPVSIFTFFLNRGSALEGKNLLHWEQILSYKSRHPLKGRAMQGSKQKVCSEVMVEKHPGKWRLPANLE